MRSLKGHATPLGVYVVISKTFSFDRFIFLDTCSNCHIFALLSFEALHKLFDCCTLCSDVMQSLKGHARQAKLCVLITNLFLTYLFFRYFFLSCRRCFAVVQRVLRLYIKGTRNAIKSHLFSSQTLLYSILSILCSLLFFSEALLTGSTQSR